MDAASAQALSLRLLPGLLLFARRKGWAEPRPVSAQQLQQFQILVALTLATARPLPPAPARAPDTSRQEPGLFGTLRSLDRQMDTYEDTRLLDLARNEIPMDRIRAEATALQQSADPLSEHDALAQALVQWFKHDYFKWADPIKCPKCDGSTDVAGMVPATDHERKGGAGRVELHVCKGENGACDGSFRFARFNNLEYLMRTRLGRCGEWANLYTLFLRAVGLRARYVWNAEDHVWNEYFSPAAGRWLHTDSCEAARDQPLLYDKGWGKKMSYIIAFSVDGASDVSRGYVQNSNEMLQRRKLVSEPALAEEISRLTAARRRNLSPARQAELAAEDETERAWLAESDKRAAPDEHARQSGTQEWKEARGEAGPSA